MIKTVVSLCTFLVCLFLHTYVWCVCVFFRTMLCEHQKRFSPSYPRHLFSKEKSNKLPILTRFFYYYQFSFFSFTVGLKQEWSSHKKKFCTGEPAGPKHVLFQFVKMCCDVKKSKKNTRHFSKHQEHSSNKNKIGWGRTPSSFSFWLH